MDHDLCRALYKAYPNVFPEKNKHGLDHFSRFGFQVGSGWYKPLQELGRQLTAVGGVVVRRCMEDRGHLQVVCDAPPAKHARVKQIVESVMNSCLKHCEVCGQAGVYIPEDRRVMCQRCAREEGVEFDPALFSAAPPPPKLEPPPDDSVEDFVNMMLGLPQEEP